MLATGLDRREVRELCALAAPSVAASALAQLLLLVDLAFLGRLGDRALGAASLGTALFFIVWYPLAGVVTALDTLAANAYGAGDGFAVRVWSIITALVLTVLLVPLSALLWYSDSISRSVFAQPPETSQLIGVYCRWLLVGMPFFVASTVLGRCQQAEGRFTPSVVAGLVANATNVLFNFVLIDAYGFVGSPLATSASRAVSLAVLVLAEWRHLRGQRPSLRRRTPRAGWEGYRAAACNRDALRRFLRLGVPGALMFALECWAFDFTTVLAGRFGTVPLDAHTVLYSLASFTYMSFPVGVATAATVRVGHLLGGQRAAQAKTAAETALLLGSSFMLLCGALFALFRDDIGPLFTGTRSSAVDSMVSRLAPIVAVFQVLDGFQGVAGGVFRALGRQTWIALNNLCVFTGIGMPLGALLGFGAGMEVAGLWWGLFAGLAAACLAYSYAWLRIDWQHEAEAAAARSCLEQAEAEATLEKVRPLFVADATA